MSESHDLPNADLSPRAVKRIQTILEAQLESGEQPPTNTAIQAAWAIVQLFVEPPQGIRRQVKIFTLGDGGIGLQSLTETRLATVEIDARGSVTGGQVLTDDLLNWSAP